MAHDYSRWDKIVDSDDEGEARGGRGAAGVSLEDLDRVWCSKHNLYHDLSQECPKCAAPPPRPKPASTSAEASQGAEGSAGFDLDRDDISAQVQRGGEPRQSRRARAGDNQSNARDDADELNPRQPPGQRGDASEALPPPPPPAPAAQAVIPSSDEELEVAFRKKDEGNAALAAGDFAAATACYITGLEALGLSEATPGNESGLAENSSSSSSSGGGSSGDGQGSGAQPEDPWRPPPDMAEPTRKLALALYLNLALAAIKQSEWEAAAAAASRALTLDPASHKALFRRGLARMNLQHLSSARKDLNRALKLNGKDKQIRETLRQVQNAIDEDDEHERNRAGLRHLKEKLEAMDDESFSMDEAMREMQKMYRQLPGSDLKKLFEKNSE